MKPGRNDIEVRVAKESANKSVNLAERRGDYWTFGGIYRPVWLEARPRDHMTWIAIDARADGSFTRAGASQPAAAPGTRVSAQVRRCRGQAHGRAAHGSQSTGDTADDHAESSPRPRLWTAETPNLYTAEFALQPARGALHERARALRLSHARGAARAMASISTAARSCSRASTATASARHRPHADARAELRRRAAHQGPPT